MKQNAIEITLPFSNGHIADMCVLYYYTYTQSVVSMCAAQKVDLSFFSYLLIYYGHKLESMNNYIILGLVSAKFDLFEAYNGINLVD